MYMIVTAVILSIFLYLESFHTLWFIAGLIFGLLNLYFIQKILYEILITQPKKPLKIALFILIKFPLLYGLSFTLLFYQGQISWTLIPGFIVALVVGFRKMLKETLKMQAT